MRHRSGTIRDMSTIGIGMRNDRQSRGEDGTSRLIAAATMPVRRWAERRIVVLTGAVVLIVGIFALRELTGSKGDAISLLYVIPVALVALELGLRGGLVAAAAATAAVALWMSTRATGLDAVALLMRALIFLAVATIAGRFSDATRATSARDGRLLHSGLALARLDEASSLAELIVEHISRAVPSSWVSVTLEGAPASVSRGEPLGETLRLPILSHRSRVGSIEVSSRADRRFSPEDRLMLETLALQAAVASDNQRLLAVERERAVLQSEIARMRRRLGDQARNATHVIEQHEQERRGIARQLHEEAAQTMAAALLTVGLLERAPGELTQEQLQEVRSQVKASIVDLRRLAATLRPVVLEEMGLHSALQRISELEQEEGRRAVTFTTHGLPEGLPRELETAAYRAIEEMLDALACSPSIAVDLVTEERSMRIVLEASTSEQRVEGEEERGGGFDRCLRSVQSELAATRARLELIGGSLHVGAVDGPGTRIVAELPIAAV